MLLAQQKLFMLKALEEQSLQASMLPIIPPPIVDSDDEEPLHAPQIAADSLSSECIRLKFMSKTKQQVVVQPCFLFACFFLCSQLTHSVAQR